ncbi:hypothetical protein [Wenyingzhuangia marina]|uniref:Uncharacterized protein n=2 Tax=Wenyingzhuangia marina TaxID=1195760 RepID=A0A1M5VJF9_9FLAO|nr:hypothetical protein [Wenyingzhuangia marina]SHH75347.1 hypothetical protein SAMN05444281_1849 [Wenyingzhuangia marina]
MIGKLRNNKFLKFICGFTGLYMLNISIDTTDPNPNYIPEDLSFNDQESIIEIVLEKVLGYEDAIEEYDDNDTENYTTKSSLKIDFIVYTNNATSLEKSFFNLCRQKFIDDKSFLTSAYLELKNPPPKF